MTAPTYVLTDWKTSTFLPGTGLPAINNKVGTYISDQNTLDAIELAAQNAGVDLVYSDTGQPPGPGEPGSPAVVTVTDNGDGTGTLAW